jgi:frizzled 4
MDPPLDIRDSVVPMPTNKVKTVQPACQYLLKSNLYVRLNRSNRCVPLCEADIVFDSNEKHMAEMWIFSWSMAALFLALLATLCLILSNSRWDKKIMPLVICHFMSNVSWAIRILAGRNATSCSYDPQLPGISLLLSDGLSTSPCSSIFLLRYYFGMSAPIWYVRIFSTKTKLIKNFFELIKILIRLFDFKRVAILSYGWNNRVKHHIKEAYGSVAMKNDKHNTLFQILSFGLPAILTVITLIARYVDADELLGKIKYIFFISIFYYKHSFISRNLFCWKSK